MDSVPRSLMEIQVINRVCNLPLIKPVIKKSAMTYTDIKNSNKLLRWILMTAESSATVVLSQAAPIAKKLETPINFVDKTLCNGLDQVENVVVPNINKQQKLIRDNVRTLITVATDLVVKNITYTTDRAVNQATSIKKKVTVMLDSPYLKSPVDELNKFSLILEYVLDTYLPPDTKEEVQGSESAENNEITNASFGITAQRILLKSLVCSYNLIIQSTQNIYNYYFLTTLCNLAIFCYFFTPFVPNFVV